jgi:hypothetical protein
MNPAGLVVLPTLCLQAVVGGATEFKVATLAARIRVTRYSDAAVTVALLAVWFLRLAGLVQTV